MNKPIVRKPDEAMNVLFVHSKLDDLGLKAETFRVYCHLARRAGAGYAYPGLRSIAVTCRLNVKTVRKCIDKLEQLGMVIVTERVGYAPLYSLTESGKWHTPTTLGHRPLQNEATKGNPLKGNPKKVIHKLDDAERIYNLYPRKIAKAGAIKAITKAIAENGVSSIETATKAYAKAVAAWPENDKKFIPFPSTWFNRGSYEDDPAEWERKPDKRFDAPKQKPLIEIKSTADDPFFS